VSTSDKPSSSRRAQPKPKKATKPAPASPPLVADTKAKHTKPPEATGISSVELQQEMLHVLRPVVMQGREQEAVTLVRSLMLRYQGPIPLAAEFKAYEEAVPGAGSRILAMAEANQVNAFEINRDLIDREGELRGRGQLLAFFALMAMLLLTGACVLTGHPIVGTAFGTGTVVAVVAMFLMQQATIKDGNTEVTVGGDGP